MEEPVKSSRRSIWLGVLIGGALGYFQYVFLPQKQAEAQLKQLYARTFAEFAPIVGWANDTDEWTITLVSGNEGGPHARFHRAGLEAYVRFSRGRLVRGGILGADLSALKSFNELELKQMGERLYHYRFRAKPISEAKVHRLYEGIELKDYVYKCMILNGNVGARVELDENRRVKSIWLSGYPDR